MEETKVKYLVFDVESVPDGKLIKNAKYPDENFSEKEAIEHFQNEILSITNGNSNFIPPTFQYPITVVVAKLNENFKLLELVSLDEPNFVCKDIVRKFWYGLEVLYKDATIVTFNGRGFDVPILEFMAYKFGFSAKRHFTDRGGTRYRNGNRHIDLQEALSNNHAVKLAGGLNVLAKLIGRPGKMETKGSDVYDMYQEGKIAQINDYCCCDVLDTYFVFLRYKLLSGEISNVQYVALCESAKKYLEENSETRAIFKKYIELSTWE